jgi:hypothetical protein
VRIHFDNAKHGVVLGDSFEVLDPCVGPEPEMLSRRGRYARSSVPDLEDRGPLLPGHFPQNNIARAAAMPKDHAAAIRSHILDPLRLLGRHYDQVTMADVLGPRDQRGVKLTGTTALHLEDDGST